MYFLNWNLIYSLEKINLNSVTVYFVTNNTYSELLIILCFQTVISFCCVAPTHPLVSMDKTWLLVLFSCCGNITCYSIHYVHHKKEHQAIIWVVDSAMCYVSWTCFLFLCSMWFIMLIYVHLYIYEYYMKKDCLQKRRNWPRNSKGGNWVLLPF